MTAPTYSDARDRRPVIVTRPGRPEVTAKLVSLPNTRAEDAATDAPSSSWPPVLICPSLCSRSSW